jgi:hypothetical protein
MLNEVNQVQKDKGHMFSLICGTKIKIQIQALSYVHILTEHIFKSGTVRTD